MVPTYVNPLVDSRIMYFFGSMSTFAYHLLRIAYHKVCVNESWNKSMDSVDSVNSAESMDNVSTVGSVNNVHKVCSVHC